MKISEIQFILLFSLMSGVLGMMSGGVREVPVNSPDIIRLSQIAMLKLNEGKLKAEDNPRNLVEIVKATEQIVSEKLTTLTLKISDGNVEKIYEVKSWLSKTEITIEYVNKLEEKNGGTKKSVATEYDIEEFSLPLFISFLKTHNKSYSDNEEFEKRQKNFRDNLKKIKELRENEQGTAEYGITWFADLTTEEFVNYLGLKKNEALLKVPASEIPDITLPPFFDWRQYNAVTPVKDQKHCGSCWAFSVTGNIEGQWAIKTGKLLSLSEQELIDCDKEDRGCQGGMMKDTYESIMELGGLVTEEDYPYEARERKCRLNKSEVKVKLDSFVSISDDELDMAKWLLKNGPMSAALNAETMAFYKSGISHSPMCSSSVLNHAVLIVGFGSDWAGIPYWIIKNSWGKQWGEDGYYRLYRGDGSCGINKYVSSGVVS